MSETMPSHCRVIHECVAPVRLERHEPGHGIYSQTCVISDYRTILSADISDFRSSLSEFNFLHIPLGPRNGFRTDFFTGLGPLEITQGSRDFCQYNFIGMLGDLLHH